MNSQMIKLEQLRLDGDTQPRVAIDEAVVAEYAEAMATGAEFPPVEVFHDGAAYWLIDGFHRYHAARKASRAELAATVRNGVLADAQWASLATNIKHGLKRSNADKAKAVRRALRMKSQFTNSAIAAHVGVTDKTVAQYRNAIAKAQEKSPSEFPKVNLRTGRDGKTYDVAKIRKNAAKRRSSTATKVFMSVRPAIPAPPMMAMSMPHNPAAGAKALMALFNREFVTRLVAELQLLLAAPPEN